MKKLKVISKVFLTVIFVLPFLLQLYSLSMGRVDAFAFMPVFFACFSAYCIWFDNKKENESKIKGFIFTILQFITCFFWLSAVMTYAFALTAK